MKTINIEECHRRLLSIASAFDAICRRHAIPYYMLGGTMLGAIRHKGFIPWDDDMDFGVHRKHYQALLSALEKELPENLRLYTHQNSDVNKMSFAKISDIHSQITGTWETDGYGINIDIFPLDEGLNTKWTTKLFGAYIIFLSQIKNYIIFDASHRKGLKRLISKFLQVTSQKQVHPLLRYIDKTITRCTQKNSGYTINYFGRWRSKEIVHSHIFGEPKSYSFENQSFLGVERPDEYLSQLYGNYMKLPPEERRIVHANAIMTTEQNTHTN